MQMGQPLAGLTSGRVYRAYTSEAGKASADIQEDHRPGRGDALAAHRVTLTRDRWRGLAWLCWIEMGLPGSACGGWPTTSA